jgi:predicted RNA-binding protein YlqC (UPF0109 family)
MNDRELDKELRQRGLEAEVRAYSQRERRNNAEEDNLQDFFRDLISSYLNFPDNLKLEFKFARHRGTWALMVEPDVSDYPIVAGRLGRNYNALRKLVLYIGNAQGADIELSLEGPLPDDERFIRKQLPYRLNPQWRPDMIKSIVARALRWAKLAHIRLFLKKNPEVNEVNPYGDQTFYWFIGMRTDDEVTFVTALGQLMESMGIMQGQRLAPRPLPEIAVEKAS